ncbi:RmlC-like cupin family protein [Tieghemostelium lacteum]|uniref:RmlC-like cupin family protein n=1 Tax=Tieghemostelium lacteum TaxID=361077 RepID=A0A152A7Z3_TIELA|nr:RmlC-like cupin family protein [Tieghemostelium lacteum]|eukprot:KYR02353.1 RmlC-like cupin family protein [Tieghemostelium lacteum]
MNDSNNNNRKNIEKKDLSDDDLEEYSEVFVAEEIEFNEKIKSINNLEERIQQLEQLSEDLGDSVKNLTGQVEVLNLKELVHNQQLLNLMNEIDRKEKQHEHAQNKLNNANTNLKKEINALQDANTYLKKEIKELQNDKIELKKENSELKNILKKNTDDIEDLRDMIKNNTIIQNAEVARFVYASDLSKFYLEYYLFPLMKTKDPNKYTSFSLFSTSYAKDIDADDTAWNQHRVDFKEMHELNSRCNEIVHPTKPYSKLSVTETITKLEENIEGFTEYHDKNISKVLCNLLKNYTPRTREYRH